MCNSGLYKKDVFLKVLTNAIETETYVGENHLIKKQKKTIKK
jgi:hypothetical protein